MTSRLKRKLNDLGVDVGSPKASENFCLIGTPLPPLEKSKDTGEFVPLWKQEVRDEKGRRRLHGAFTGGFSAGYFNTVGSKEGWTPAEFTSSRSDRARKKVVRPEDFMDEEDLVELRDNQKLVDTTEEMDMEFWDRRNADSGGVEKDSITSILEATLLPAPRDSVGAQILKKMGWRVGYGIGPKITYEQRKRQDALSHVPAGSGGDLQNTADHEEARKHLYLPRDTKVLAFKRKDNKHGLGYDPGMGLSDMVSAKTASMGGSKLNEGPNISAGFGLGALNDADEDDLDVYDRGLTQTSQRLAYDADEDDEHIAMGSQSKSMRTSLQSSRAPLGINGRTTFNNGMQCVPGFVVADNAVTEENLFPPPVVPKGWVPDPRRVWEQDKENFKSSSTTQDGIKPLPIRNDQGWRRAAMTAEERGKLLGETPLPVSPRSIFDYLAPKDRERLKSLAAGRAQLGALMPTELNSVPGLLIPEPGPTIPRLDPQVAKMALQGFQPFTTDPTKQARYTAYLKAQAAGEDTVPFSRAPGQAADAFARELQDYARSAHIFKPVSGAMAGRFTRAAVVDTGSKAVEGLHRPADEGLYLSAPDVDVEQKEPEESPKENAARLGMFGPLTREVKPWTPARLLCKRFGVKEPVVEVPSEAVATTAPFSTANLQNGGVLAITDASEAGLTGSTQIGENRSAGKNGPPKSSSMGGRRDIANIGLGDEDETQGRDILTYERPGMDIFKAIFASDEEDEGEGDDRVGDEDDDVPRLGESLQHGDGAEVGNTETSRAIAGTSAVVAPLPPAAPVDYNNAAGRIDLAAFKPTFVPRSDRAKEKEREKQNHGKDKDRERKKKKSRTTLVSFEVYEDGGNNSGTRVRDRDRGTEKKRKKKSDKRMDAGEGGTNDDDSMWVEKPPPEALQNLTPSFAVSISNITDAAAADGRAEAGPPKGRKRAIDFM